MNILLAEDDKNLGYVLSEYLEMNDYSVTLATDGDEAIKCYGRKNFDLCILDVMMPKSDGFTVAEKIKDTDEDMPIIFLTARALKVDKLKGFKLGADDYIIKPVDEEELIARINAIVKRTRITPNESKDTKYQIGAYSFDFSNQLLSKGEMRRVITSKEADVLKALCDCKGNILDRKTALKTLWGESDYFNRRSMDVFISKLRKYLSDDDSIKIRNVHGKGFVLEVENS